MAREPGQLKYGIFRLAAWAAPRVPAGLARGAAMAAGTVMWALAPAPRRRVEATLRHIPTLTRDPARRARAVRGVFQHMALNYLDLFRVPSLAPQAILRDLEVEGREVVAAALARGRGVVLLAAHLGNFESAAAYVGDMGTPVTLPVERLRPAPLFDLVRDLRSHHGVRAIPVDTTETLRELYTTLRRGEIVLLTGDRDVAGTGAEATLFGAPVRLPTGPVLLARRSGAALIGAFSWRETGGRSRGHFVPIDLDDPTLDSPTPEADAQSPLATPGDFGANTATAVRTRARDRADVAKLLRPVARALETAIAAHPEQWVAAFAPIWSDATNRADGKEGDDR